METRSPFSCCSPLRDLGMIPLLGSFCGCSHTAASRPRIAAVVARFIEQFQVLVRWLPRQEVGGDVDEAA